MKTHRLLSIFFLFFLLTLSSQLFAYTNTYEKISNFIPDTGNMNEREDKRRFEGFFEVHTSSNDPDKYKVNDVVKDINVAVYISWKNNGSYEKVFSDSFSPVDSDGNVIPKQDFFFSKKNPISWTNPMKVVIIAQFNATPGSTPQFTYNGRGDIKSLSVETPPALADVQLGYGSTYYEGLKSFDGSLGEVDIKTGSVKIKFEVLVSIFRDPLGGAYDPTPEGVAVFADLNGGTNPNQTIYGETKLAGAYWVASGIRPTLPFDLPFNGEWLAGENIPGVIVGGTAMAWGAVPVLGQNTTWGEQNRHVWYLPPRTIEFTPDVTPDPNTDIPTFTIYDGCSFGGKAKVALRKLQIQQRITGFTWNWGDGTSESVTGTGVLTSQKTKVYNLANPTIGQEFRGSCSVVYKNSDSNSTTLEYPFKVIVKPLPSIYVPTDISISNLAGYSVAYPGEDVANHYQGIGSQRLVCYENYNTPSNYYFFYKITDGNSVSAKYPPSPSSKITHTFATLGKKYLELYVHYKGAKIINNKLVELDWDNKLLAKKEVRVESQQVLEGQAEQRITFKTTVNNSEPKVTTVVPPTPDHPGMHYHLERTLTTDNPTASIRFDGIANIFYARRDENTAVEFLDQKSGVKPGSVYYRWRVLDPDGKDAYNVEPQNIATRAIDVSDASLMSFTNIPNQGTGIKGITITFKTPFGTSVNKTRFYKVFLEAKYKELAWKPIYHNGKVIDWEEDSNYKNNNKERKIIHSITAESLENANASDKDFNFYTSASSEPVLNKEGDDLLFDGSLGWEVRINDEIPAKVVLSGIDSGTTGDAASSETITARFEDNNPDTQLKYLRVIYKRYDETAYAMSDEMYSDIIATGGYELNGQSVGYINNYLNGFSLQELNPNIGGNISNAASATSFAFFELASLKAYNDELIASAVSNKIALYADNGEWFPNSFATNMKKPNNPGIATGTFYYRVRAYYDDGKLNYIESANQTITISDNDAPSLKITVVNPETGVPRVFEIQEELHDIIATNTNISITVVDGDNPPLLSYNGSDSGGNDFFTFTNSFTAVAHQRFLCNIEVTDNVLPPQETAIDIKAKLDESNNEKELKAYLKQLSAGVYKSANPQYLFYMKPGNYNLQFTVTDTAGKIRKVQIPLEVLQEKDAKIRILKQQNEK